MMGVFSINQKVVFCSRIYFLKSFGLCLQPNTSDNDLGYSKHQRLDGLTFTMHKKNYLNSPLMSFTSDITEVTNF